MKRQFPHFILSRRTNYRKPQKKFPLLRLLLLAAFLAGLYRFINKASPQPPVPQSTAGNGIKNGAFLKRDTSGRQPNISANDEMLPEMIWNHDSSAFQVNCRIRTFAQCREILNNAYPTLGSATNTLIWEKLTTFSNRSSNKLELTFETTAEPAAPRLKTLKIFADGKKQIYRAVFQNPFPGFSGRNGEKWHYCRGPGDCLLSQVYSFPLKTGKSGIKNPQKHFITAYWPNPEIKFTGEANLSVRAIAMGKIMEITAVGIAGSAIKIYHGRGLYSHYKNLKTLVEGIRLDDMVHRGEILGTTGGKQGGFSFSVEKNGIFIEPWRIFDSVKWRD